MFGKVVGNLCSKKITIAFSRVSDPKEKATFAAYLVDYGSTHTPRWNTEFVYARMDPISIYQGTSRTISIGWTVLSEGEKDGIANMANIEKLLGLAYSTMESSDGALFISDPPVINFKFAHMNVNVIGYFSSEITFKPNLEAGFISRRGSKLIPKEVNMSCTITVLRNAVEIAGLHTKGELITSGRAKKVKPPGEKPAPGDAMAPLNPEGEPVEDTPIDDSATPKVPIIEDKENTIARQERLRQRLPGGDESGPLGSSHIRSSRVQKKRAAEQAAMNDAADAWAREDKAKKEALLPTTVHGPPTYKESLLNSVPKPGS